MPRHASHLIMFGMATLAATGVITHGAVEAERASAPIASPEASRYGLLSVGEYYSCAVKTGDIYCWGSRDWDTPSSYTPSKLTYGDDPSTPAIDESTITFDEGDVLDLSVGGTLRDSTACAVTDDGVTSGAVWCWGMNRYGQFGTGTSPSGSLPPTRAFGDATGAIEVGVGGRHVCVLFSSGYVKCAGANSSGQLGDGSTTDSTSPVDAEYTTSGATPTTGRLGSATHLLVGYDHNCALLDLGGSDEYDPWCWGSNDAGELSYGGGTYETRALRPWLPPGLSSVVGAQVGPSSTCIWSLTTAWCAGRNYQPSTDNDTPHLGTDSTNSTISYFNFGQVTSFSGPPEAMAMGITSNCALRSNGTVRCWGDNRDGWLGDGTTDDNAAGSEVLLPGPVDVIESGTATTCATDRVGQLWCWGSGTLGATGTGSSANRSTPTLLDSGSTGWTYLSTPPSPAVAVTSTVSILDDSVSGLSGRVDAGDTAQASYLVTNTGDITLESITLTDTLVADTEISCPTTSNNTIATLAPSASVTCTAGITLSQTDIDRGNIESAASVASAVPVASDSGANTLELSRVALMTITSSIASPIDTDSPANGTADPGDTVTVTHTIANTGNVTLSSVALTDSLLADTDIACAPSNTNTITVLVPGATSTCNTTHTLTQADLDAGSVTSNAIATATAPSGAANPADATATTTANITPTPTPTPTTTTTSTTAPASTTSTTTASTTTTAAAPTTTAAAQSITTVPGLSTSATATPTGVEIDLTELAASLPLRSITRSIVPVGSTIELNDTGYIPGETVTAAMATRRPKVLAQTVARADGSAAVAASLDNDLIGEVVIVMVGQLSGHGSQQSVMIESVLPTTGTRSSDATALLLFAIAGGALISLSARRRV